MSGTYCAPRDSRRSFGLIYSLLAVLILLSGMSSNVQAMGIDPGFSFKDELWYVTPGWGWNGPEFVVGRYPYADYGQHLSYHPPTWVGFGQSVAVDSSGDWIIAYAACDIDVDTNAMSGTSTTSVCLVDASSQVETVGTAVFWAEASGAYGGQCIGSPSIAYDSSGALHIAYVWTDVDTSSASIRYVRRAPDGTFSSPQTVVSGIPAVELTSGVGYDHDDWDDYGFRDLEMEFFWGRRIPLVSIATDASGNWYVSYVLRQAGSVGGDPAVDCSVIVVGSGGSGPWTLATSQRITPESGPQTGSEISCSAIAIDGNGEMHLAYMERTCDPLGSWPVSHKGAVRYRHGVPGQTFSAPETVAVGARAWVSIAVDSTGKWMIAYANALRRLDPLSAPFWRFLQFIKIVGSDFAPRTLVRQEGEASLNWKSGGYGNLGEIGSVDVGLSDSCYPHAAYEFLIGGPYSEVVHDVRLDCSEPDTYELTIGKNDFDFRHWSWIAGTTSPIAYAHKTYAPGTTVEVAATPIEGTQFIRWEGDIETTDNPAQVFMDGDKEIEAIFGVQLDTSVQGQGSVQLNPPDGVFRPESNVQATAVPASGWRFAYWAGEGVTDILANPTTIETPDEASTVQAVFAEQAGDEWLLATGVVGQGSLDVTPDTILYEDGAQVTLEAFPASGWIFDHWEGDLEGNQNPVTITMDSDKTIMAVFSTGDWSLETNVVGQGTLVTTPATILHEDGAQVTLEAIAEPGWEFDHWEGDLIDRANPRTLTMDGDKSVTAVFLETVLVTIQGEGEVDFYRQDGMGLGYAMLIARSASGWRFDHWEGDLEGTRNPRYFDWSSGMEVTAVFVPLEPGSISGTVRDLHTGGVMAGAQVTVTGAAKQSVVTDSEGQYTITGLAPGVYDVRAAAPSYLDLVKQVTVSTGAGSTADFALSRAGVHALSVTPLIRSVDVPAGSTTFTVESPDGVPFVYLAVVTDGADWLSITNGTTGRNGDTITVAFTENTWGHARAGSVLVTTPGALDSPFYVAVAQLGIPAQLGDVDTNGLADAVDIQLVINSVLGGDCEHNCDVDGNGKVDAVDIQLAINAALGVTR